MYLTFTSKGHETKTFTKNLLKSDFSKEKSKIGIDIGIVATIFLIGSILAHILITWIFWGYK